MQQCIANNRNLQTFVGLTYSSQIKSGYMSAFAFHDHDPKFGNSNFHVHNYCNPFVTGKEVLQNLVLNGQYVVNKKITITISLPYSLKTQLFGDSINLFRKGIGDIELGVKYSLFESEGQQLRSSIKQQTLLAVYTTLKTGKYNVATDLNDIDPHIQNGNGSTGWRASLQHFINFSRWDLSGAFDYLLKTKNYYQFKKGNSYKASIAASYNFNFSNDFLLKPAINLSYLNKIADTMEDKLIVKPTGYKAFSIGTNIEFRYKNTVIGFKYETPIYLNYQTNDARCKAPEMHQNFGLSCNILLFNNKK